MASLPKAVKHGDIEKVEELLSWGAYQVNCTDSEGRTPLHIACGKGYCDLVIVLVGYGADFNARDKYDHTPLTLAARKFKFECVLFIIKKFYCDVNRRAAYGKTLLHYACQYGNVELVNALVQDCKADLTIQDHFKNTPILLAVKNNKIEIVKLLVCDYNCDPNTRDCKGKSLLHYACADGNIDLVHVLVRDCKADLNIENKYVTPLETTAENNQYEVLKSLVCDYGCDPNVKIFQDNSLLHVACADGNIDLVHVLVRVCKVDLSIEKNYGVTPLETAAESNQHEVLKSLVCDYGCNPYVKNFVGKPLLHIACADGNIDLVHVLIQNCGADLKVRDDFGDTPLMTAARYHKCQVFKSLVFDYGCDPNITDYNGKSPLHHACAGGNIDLVHVLVRDCKADMNIEDDCSVTPLETAAENNQYKVWKSLICDYGYDPNVQDSSGRSLLHHACADGDINLVHVLARDCKANLNIEDNCGVTPLEIAAIYAQKEVFKSLLYNFGCNNIKDHYSNTILHYACADDDIDLVHVLVRDCKASLDIRNDFPDTPLMTAVANNNFEVVKVLISDYKCDVSITNSEGRSLLHMAGGVEVLKLLIQEYKMSPSLVDNYGNTPLHWLILSKNFTCVEALLFDFHAPIYVRNRRGITPKDLATFGGKTQIIILDTYLTKHGREIEADYHQMQFLAAKTYSGSKLTSRLFVVGHPGAGKSSLVETLKREGLLKSFSRVSEKLVPPHTTGIVPSIYISDNCGRIQFYDFAGDPEYYSSHAAILERLFQSNIGTNICIIVLNLLEGDVEIEKKYLFWLSFVNYSFKRLEESPSVLVIGSHSDQISDKKEVSRKNYYIQDLISKYRKECVYLSLDCCSPRSSNIRSLRQIIQEISQKSQPYSLSPEESILLGLLEKDFSNVTACTAQTIASHIEQLNLGLPRSVSLLYPILQQLQAIGVLLLVGGKEEDCYVILNVAQLTNEVHKKLFPKDAFSINPSLSSFNVGLLPESLLQEVLPKYITKECLIQLQYCQEVSHIEIGSDYSVSPSYVDPDISTSPDKSYLFFPALCNLDKKVISWQTPPEHSYSIGWLARCRDPHDYFPSRFLHVLLLRIALRFTLIVPSCAKVTPDHIQLKRQCEMWKTGVHWLSEEEVECEVEVIDSKEVAVSLQSVGESKTCLSLFNCIVSCVMEAKAEFCDFIVFDCFLLDKVSCLTDDNLFSVEDVERVLREVKPSVLSVNGKKLLNTSKFVHISSSFWSSLFPIDEHQFSNTLRLLSGNGFS